MTYACDTLFRFDHNVSSDYVITIFPLLSQKVLIGLEQQNVSYQRKETDNTLEIWAYRIRDRNQYGHIISKNIHSVNQERCTY